MANINVKIDDDIYKLAKTKCAILGVTLQQYFIMLITENTNDIKEVINSDK